MTGTDTGVGKTAIAAALAAWCRAQGLDVGVMKPVATGLRRAGRGGISDDARRLAAASGSCDAWSLITPVAFREPLAPAVAARRAGRRVSMRAILAAYRVLRRRHRLLIVEGIGGALVPLNDRETVADLARRLRLPAVIVSRAGLGAINHTLLSVEALRRRRVRIAGVILNAESQGAAASLAGRTNPVALRRLLRVPVLGLVPFSPRQAARPDAAWLEQSLGRRALRRLFNGVAED